MAGRTQTPGLVRHRAFEAKVNRQYLTRTGRLARLAKIEPDASGDDILHFEYLDPPPDAGALGPTKTRKDGFQMHERVASRLMVRVD
jgi:hypothetical protein